MMKQKNAMTALDITAVVNNLKERLVGLRVSNIYDINAKTYLIKFSRNDVKEVFIVENGVRFHTTSAQIEKKKMPSVFAMKFRKSLKAKKLEDIRQVGVERVVDMTFGTGDGCHHLILEFYSQGNIILTDKDYKIIQCIRSHVFNEKAKTAVGEIYPFEFAANLSIDKFEISREKIFQIVESEKQKQEDREQQMKDELEKKKQEELEKQNKKPQKQKPNEKSQKKKQFPVKQAGKKITEILFQMLPSYHPKQIDHFLKKANMNPSQKFEESLIDDLLKVAQTAFDFLKNYQSTKNHQGYLILSENQPKVETETPIEDQETKDKDQYMIERIAGAKQESDKIKEYYSEYTPFMFSQHEECQYREHKWFVDAIDLYFQNQQIVQTKTDHEVKAWKKYENIKQDQENRLLKLRQEQDEFIIKAQLIEGNIDDVDAIINIIHTMVQGGLNWDKINKMINDGRKSGDPLANMIQKINWQDNEVVVYLSTHDEEEDEENEQMLDVVPVAVNFTMTAFLNAQRYYQQKKKHCVKEQKTVDAANMAIKIAEKTAKSTIEKKKVTDVVNARKVFWWEKFYWFVTSENYLVIHGRDMQQNELIVKKYLGKDDIYMHADFHGAASTVIKNTNPGQPVPDISLQEAACSSVCRSKAWDNKLSTQAWWVYAHQVSKSAETGEYLPTGSFMVRGKKNFINPARMEMGFGLFFKLDISSVKNHIGERKIKGSFDDKYQLELTNEQKEFQNEEVTLVEAIAQNKAIITMNKQQLYNKAKSEQMKQMNKDNEKNGKKGKKDKKNKNEEEEEEKVTVQKVPRGKQAKMKKLEKYKDQTEEEKQFKLKLLGAKEMKVYDPKIIEANKQEAYRLKQEQSEQYRINAKLKREKKQLEFKNGKKQEEKMEEKQEEKIEEKPMFGDDDKEDKQENLLDMITNKDKQDTQQQKIDQNDEKIEEKSQQIEEKIVQKEEIKSTLDTENPDKNLDKEDKQSEEQKQQQSSQEQKNEKEQGNNSDDSDIDEEKLEKLQLENQQTSNMIEEQETEETLGNQLDYLTGNPKEDDVYYNIIPVCAPYSALLTYKFKVKLLPGNLKKGKASKASLSIFSGMKETTDIQRKMIKQITDLDMVNNMIGNCRVQGAGIQKFKDKEKAEKKKLKQLNA